MPLTTRKRTFKKAGATIEEELSETRYGKIRGFSKKDMEALFRIVKGSEERMKLMNYAIENNLSLSVLIRRFKEERKKRL
jgi:dephospho-CoA kinase